MTSRSLFPATESGTLSLCQEGAQAPFAAESGKKGHNGSATPYKFATISTRPAPAPDSAQWQRYA